MSLRHVEASALTQPAAAGGRSPLLRLQSDERLIALVRRGNHGAFEVLVGRYQSRLLAFCRHMLGSREDAEDVLQEVFAAAYNAIRADDRPINARPWLYRIARNRSLNHLRRVQPIGVDSMDVHLSDHGATTADKVDKREQFRELIADVQQLPETQRTALLLREIDALSYEQIAEAMETTIPSVKSLLVRARVSLAEAAEARQLSCEDVRVELGEIAEGLRRRTTAPARRHLRSCERCGIFRTELRATSKALALMLPVGPLLLAKRLLLAHVGLSGGVGSAASGTAAAGAVATGAAGAGAGGGLVSAGIGALGTKAAAGIAAAALVTAGAVEIERHAPRQPQPQPQVVAQQPAPVAHAAVVQPAPARVQRSLDAPAPPAARAVERERERTATTTTPATTTETTPATTPAAAPVADPGHTYVESGATTLPATLPTTAPPPTLVPAPAPAATTPTPTATTPVPPTDGTTPPPAATVPTPPPAETIPEPVPPAVPPAGATTPEAAPAE